MLPTSQHWSGEGKERQWQLQDAKAHFSEVVKRAQQGEAQLITKRGEKAVVVLSYDQYEQLQGVNKILWDIFKTAPRLDEDELPLERDKTAIVPFELE